MQLRRAVCAVLLAGCLPFPSHGAEGGGAAHAAPRMNRTITAWDTADVVAWFGELGLAEYGDKVASAELDGAAVLAKGVEGVVGVVGVTNPVHVAKLAAHLSAAGGDCPCSLTQGGLGLGTVFDRYHTELYLFAAIMTESPRTFFLLWRYWGYDWAGMVSPPVGSGMAWSLSHRPEPYFLSDADADAGGGGGGGFSSAVLFFAPAVLCPYLMLAWGATYFWATNPYATVVLCIVLCHGQLCEVMDLLTWDVSSLATALEPLFPAFVQRTVSKWPLVPILLAQFLSTYIFPVWLEKLVVTLFVLYLLSRTVIGFLNAIMEPEEGEGEGAEGAPAAEGAEGDAGHSHTEDMD